MNEILARNGWDVVVTLMMMILFLAVATIIKSRSKFLRRHFVPAALLAGFMGLVLGPEVINLIKFDPSVLEKLVYHLSAIGFIALTLKTTKGNKNLVNFNTGVLTVLTYVFQAIIGLVITIIFIFLDQSFDILPNLSEVYPAFGFLLPLGFGQGPGAAFNGGNSWAGFVNGGNIGLTVAAIGFVWAFIGGVPLINMLVKNFGLKSHQVDVEEMERREKESQRTSAAATPRTIYIDDVSLQLILIGIVYFITFGFLSLVEYGLRDAGNFGQTLINLFWGFNFLFGIIFALLAKMVLKKIQQLGWIRLELTDNYLLSRIGETSFDVMIVSGISAVSISALEGYFLPVMVLTAVGGILTAVFLYKYAPWVYKDHVPEFIAVGYGTWTGTITTGVALVREIDPYGETPVIEAIAVGSGYAAPFGLPLFLIPGMIVYGYLENLPWMIYVTLGVLVVYYAFLHTILHFTRQK